MLGRRESVGDADRRCGRARRAPARRPARVRFLRRPRSWLRRVRASPGSPSSARTSATSCRSPTDNDSPRSPTIVARPSGRRINHQSRPSRAKARSMSSSVAAGAAMRTLSAIVVSNRKPSCGTIRIARRRESGSTSRRSRSPMRTSPSVGSASRHRSLANVVLPEPVSPTTATCAPAGDVDAHVVQHRRVAAVREPDVRHSHGEGAVGEMHAVDRFDDVDRHVEHREDLAPTGDRGLGLVEDLAQLADRAQHQVDQEHERDDRADVEPPVAAVVAPRPRRRRRVAIAPKKSPSGNIAAKYFAARTRARYAAVDARSQSHAGPLLQPVGANDRGAGDSLGELGDHVADAAPFLVVGRELATLERAEQRRDRYVRDQRDDRELPGVDEHHDERADEQRAVHQPRDHPPLHEAGQRLDVARDARHEHAAPGRGVLGHAQPVDVLEHANPQVARVPARRRVPAGSRRPG